MDNNNKTAAATETRSNYHRSYSHHKGRPGEQGGEQNTRSTSSDRTHGEDSGVGARAHGPTTSSSEARIDELVRQLRGKNMQKEAEPAKESTASVETCRMVTHTTPIHPSEKEVTRPPNGYAEAARRGQKITPGGRTAPATRGATGTSQQGTAPFAVPRTYGPGSIRVYTRGTSLPVAVRRPEETARRQDWPCSRRTARPTSTWS